MSKRDETYQLNTLRPTVSLAEVKRLRRKHRKA